MGITADSIKDRKNRADLEQLKEEDGEDKEDVREQERQKKQRMQNAGFSSEEYTLKIGNIFFPSDIKSDGF